MVINKQHGFTLIELMLVLAVVAVLVAMAYPSYGKYRVRTNRADAQKEMIYIAQRMQMYKAANGSYTNATLNIVYGGTVTPKQGTALYDLSFPTDPTATGWLLVATPKSGKRQAGDGALTLTDTAVQCWYKGKDTFTASDTCYKWSDK